MTALTHVTEKQWQAQVLELLALTGFDDQLTYHPWTSVHSAAGWPDIAAIRRDDPGFTLAVLELKRETGKTTAAQDRWLAAWGGIAATVNGVSSTVRIITGSFRPSDFSLLTALLQERHP